MSTVIEFLNMLFIILKTPNDLQLFK